MVRRLRNALFSRQHATKRSLAYSLAASAAAVAVASDANATIVYSGTLNTSIGQGSSLLLNFDVAGGNDLRLKNYILSGVNYFGATSLTGKLASFNAGVSSFSYVSALASGFSINSTSANPNTFGSMAKASGNPNAAWNTPMSGLMGFSFTNGANTYYGWLRTTVNVVAGSFVVNDWAYDNTPGTAIAAGVTAIPEASPLGLLAAGSLGLVALRRLRKSREANEGVEAEQTVAT